MNGKGKTVAGQREGRDFGVTDQRRAYPCMQHVILFLYTFHDVSKKVSDFLWGVGGGIEEVHVLFTSNASLFQRH